MEHTISMFHVVFHCNFYKHHELIYSFYNTQTPGTRWQNGKQNPPFSRKIRSKQELHQGSSLQTPKGETLQHAPSAPCHGHFSQQSSVPNVCTICHRTFPDLADVRGIYFFSIKEHLIIQFIFNGRKYKLNLVNQ